MTLAKYARADEGKIKVNHLSVSIWVVPIEICTLLAE